MIDEILVGWMRNAVGPENWKLSLRLFDDDFIHCSGDR